VESEEVNNICLHYILCLQIVFILCVRRRTSLFNVLYDPCNRLTIYYAWHRASAAI
jgi:hypothetical protein